MLQEREIVNEFCSKPLTNSDVNKNKTVKNEFSVAWCSWHDNSINIHGYYGRKDLVDFDGAQLPPETRHMTNSYNLVHQVPHSNHIISASTGQGATFKVFDASNNMLEVANHTEPRGVICDVSCNEKTQRVALLGITKETQYHLFDSSTWKLIRKANWQSDHINRISGLDFDPQGQKIVAVDYSANCIVSDVLTDECLMSISLGGISANWKRCRWNPMRALIAVSYDENKLTLIDPIKKQASNPNQLHKEGITWIDWHKEGNLLASCSWDRMVKIFDVRKGGVVRTFHSLHNNRVNCVRWSASGELIVTASNDLTLKVVDFKSGKVIHTINADFGTCPSSATFLETPKQNN